MRDVWSESNPGGSIPNPKGSSRNFETNSRYVEDGSYLRLKNVQLGYTLPASFTEKMHISRARVYVSANNLLTPVTTLKSEVVWITVTILSPELLC